MKILLIRFSSFGDVLQTLSVVGALHKAYPQAEIHWVTRAEFVPLMQDHPHLHKTWTLPKGAGLKELWKLGRLLKAEDFTHIYDAHNNLRSHILSFQLGGILGWRRWLGGQKFLRRSIYRWRRFLLFRFRKNLFPKPFSGQFALLEPLTSWGIRPEAPPPPQLFLPATKVARGCELLPEGFNDFIALAPSAAFALKRWPLDYWKELIGLLPEQRFVVLGGPEDTFLQELPAVAPERVINLSGRLSLLESASVVNSSRLLVANDTGLMHVAEQLGKPCIALMGPAPFGYPSRPLTRILELELSCRPCSKHGQGPCVNVEYHKCLRGIAPGLVAKTLKGMLNA